jgi:predicted Zn finger-like uncharacterized protein
MDVRCDRCETEYELEDSSVSDAGTSVQCTTCGHRFIVTRRPSSPLHQVALATPSPTTGSSPGTSVVAPEPGVPEWTLSTDDGKVHRFRDLNTLQKWIVERKASRTDRLSRAGGPWLALGDMDELAPFFTVVDQADRARVSVPTPARLGGPAAAMPSRPASPSQPAPTPAHAPAQSASAAPPSSQQPRPPVPFDARKTVSPDGPTVPNRRLPDARSGRHPDPGAAVTRPATRTPGIGLHPVGHAHVPGGASSSSSSAAAQVTPVASSSPSLAATTPFVSAAPSVGSGALGSGTRRAPTPEPQRSVPPINRPTMRTDAVFDVGPLDESASLAADFGVPNHRVRNVLIAAAVIVLGGGGAFGYWSQQQKAHAPGGAASRTHVATPALAAKVPAEPPGSVGEGTTPKPAAEPARAPSAVNAEIPPASTAVSPPLGAGKVALGDANRAGSPAPAAATGRTLPPSGGARPGGAARASDSGAAEKTSSPASYDRMVADGDRLLEHGQAARAEKLYTQALAAKPDGVAALTGIGYVLLDKQRHLKAIETFRRVLDNQPTYGPALFGIAESYRARGDSAQALGAYRQYLAVSPSGSDAPAARRQIKELEGGGERPPSASASRKDTDDTEEE